jgi:transglutaminase-like putative cysteine protease
MNPYLRSTPVIDWEHASVVAQARMLRASSTDPIEIARRCFEWVRDEIRHSGDYRLHVITCRASEVLQAGSGYCYAKSHLLAALLRANGIASGLCYQRMSIDDQGLKHCLHGLNAVLLPDFGWFRMDARGNKAGVNAQFVPPQEKLAFVLTGKGEATLPEIWPEPLPIVVETIRSFSDAVELGENLPDVALWMG